MNEIPRRSRLNFCQPAELAIYNAVQEVEKMPADIRLTNAVILLSKAKDSVADYIDGIQSHPTTQPQAPDMEQDEIQKMAEEFANTCFVNTSFRWNHVVKMYLKGISDYRLRLLQKAQLKSEETIDSTSSRKPYPDELKVTIFDQQAEDKIKARNETNTELKRIWKLDEDDKTISEKEREFITSYYVKMAEYWQLKSQPQASKDRSKDEILKELTGGDPYGQFSEGDMAIIYKAMTINADQEVEKVKDKIYAEVVSKQNVKILGLLADKTELEDELTQQQSLNSRLVEALKELMNAHEAYKKCYSKSGKIDGVELIQLAGKIDNANRNAREAIRSIPSTINQDKKPE